MGFKNEKKKILKSVCYCSQHKVNSLYGWCTCFKTASRQVKCRCVCSQAFVRITQVILEIFLRKGAQNINS